MRLNWCVITYYLIINEVLQALAFLIPVELVLDSQDPTKNLDSEEWRVANEIDGKSEQNQYNKDLMSNDIGDTMMGIPVLLNILSLGTHSGKKETNFSLMIFVRNFSNILLIVLFHFNFLTSFNSFLIRHKKWKFNFNFQPR